MLKVELHSHTSDDRSERIPHTTFELIDRAAELHYDALAITLHDKQLNLDPFTPYAQERGLVLIPGVERGIEGRHVLLINFPQEAERIESFDELAELKARSQGVVIAPHPFYPISYALHGLVDRHAALFDAVELNAMYTPGLNFNARAVRWARARGKPIVGNGDVHVLDQLGTTFSWVDANPNPDSICAAVREGRVRVDTKSLSALRAGWIFLRMTIGGWRKPLPVETLPEHAASRTTT